jgi:hypothetical protein
MNFNNLLPRSYSGEESCEVLQEFIPRTSKIQERNGTYINFHPLVDTIVHDQAVGQPDTMRLHGMTCDVCIVTNVGVVEVGHFGLVTAGELGRREIERRKRRHCF